MKKICLYCKQKKELEEFHNKTKKGISHILCKKCRQLGDSYYAGHKIEILKRQKKYHKKNRTYKKVYNANYLAEKLNVSGVLTEKEIRDLKNKTGNFCPSCKNKFDKSKNGQWSIDHIIPFSNPDCINKISNIQIICFKCNAAKREKIIKY